MSGPGPATKALLASTLHRHDRDPDHSAREIAQDICRACVRGLDVDGASVSLMPASAARETLWASDATAELLEELQFTLNEGACIEAAASGAPVLVPDLLDPTDSARWPAFTAAVIERTLIRALFALPLQWGTSNLGVLDLYRATPGGLGRAQWQDAVNVAQLGSGLMLAIRTAPPPPLDDSTGDTTDEGPDGGIDRFDPSLSDHYEVHQATGMVLAQLGVSATEALARMRAYAYTHDWLLTDVAREVIDRRLVFTDDPDTDDPDKDNLHGGTAG